jgi:hypothetical protein
MKSENYEMMVPKMKTDEFDLCDWVTVRVECAIDYECSSPYDDEDDIDVKGCEIEEVESSTPGYGDIIVSAELGELIKSSNARVRKAVVKAGIALDILINDPDKDVRMAVAEKGYGLDVLVNDPSDWVRCVVARLGYGLDILANDPDASVRFNVATYVHDEWERLNSIREMLVNDEDAEVREAIKSGR